jgi:hypothetical protein
VAGKRGQRHRRQRAAGRRDLPGRARRLAHPRRGKLLGVGVAGGIPAHDAHPKTDDESPAHAAHLRLFQNKIGRAAELEVQVGVLPARGQGLAQQSFSHRRVDRDKRVWGRAVG